MTGSESWQREWGGRGKFKRNSEETKGPDDRLKMGVDEERGARDVSRVSDLRDWKNVSTTVKNGEMRRKAKSRLGCENTEFKVISKYRCPAGS